MRKLLVALVFVASGTGAFGTAACATPADVQAQYERDVQNKNDDYTNAVRNHQRDLNELEATRNDDMRSAEEWNDHFMGIPAAGWVPILVFACVLLTILTGLGGYQVFALLQDRRDNQRTLALEREKTLRVRAQRSKCDVCGTDPLTSEERQKLGEPT